jgi:transcriptional antiterminator/mannitol/fructose-specific phosphotransferase system IIA component (Ntr-type)
MNKRQVDLFKFLCAKKNYVSAKNLSQLYKVSTKTIYQDIAILVKIITHCDVKIDKKPRVGIKVEGSDINKRNVTAQLDLMLKEEPRNIDFSPLRRRVTMVKDLILEGNDETLKHLSNRWLVSKTSILNDINWINRIIAIDHSGIQSDGACLRFTGYEEQRQTAVTTFVVATSTDKRIGSSQYLQEFFDANIVQELSSYFERNQLDWLDNVPTYYQFALQIITLVQTTRAKHGHHMPVGATTQGRNDFSGDSAKVATELFETITNHLDVNFTQGDLEWLIRNLSAYRVGLVTVGKDWHPLVKKLIHRMESLQEGVLPGQQLLEHQLMFHLPAMVLRLQQGLIVRNPLLSDIKAQYPELFGMTWYAMSFLEERYNIELNDDEVSFITIYFHIAINQVITSRNVLIVFNQHGQLRDYVKSQIRMLLPQNTKYMTTNLTHLKQVNLSEIGLVVGVNVNNLITSLPFVSISPLFDANDQTKLLRAYADFLIKPQSSQITTHFPVLKKYVDPKLIFWKPMMSNKQDALNFLIDQLEAAGKVESGFRKSIFRRERLGATELDSGASLPHAAPETVRSLSVVFLVLQKPLYWNSVSVSIIVLACVPEEKMEIYRELVMDIYRLVQTKQMVQMIVGLNNTQKFMALINQ